MEKPITTAFIFYLKLEDRLPENYYKLSHFLHQHGFLLVPVTLDQIQNLSAISEQAEMIVICSVTNTALFKIYTKKIKGLLKYILKNKLLTIIHLSSYDTLNEISLLGKDSNYFFIKYPIEVERLCRRILNYYEYRSSFSYRWPGANKVTSEASE